MLTFFEQLVFIGRRQVRKLTEQEIEQTSGGFLLLRRVHAKNIAAFKAARAKAAAKDEPKVPQPEC